MMMDVDMDTDETNDESLSMGNCSVICPLKITPISESSPLNSRLHSVEPKSSLSDCDVACFVEEVYVVSIIERDFVIFLFYKCTSSDIQN